MFMWAFNNSSFTFYLNCLFASIPDQTESHKTVGQGANCLDIGSATGSLLDCAFDYSCCLPDTITMLIVVIIAS